MATKQVEVAVGVIYRDRHFFICKRKASQHQGDKWEFPGGKVDAGESAEQALVRELKEEIDIVCTQQQALTRIVFDYPEKTVSLQVFLVTDFTGTAKGAEGQEAVWVSADMLSTYTFPDANKQILDELEKRKLI